MEKQDQKRERSTNFAANDVEILLFINDLVFKYKDIIECKKTDAQTWKTKEEKWNKSTSEFNLQSPGPPRTQKSLKTKYDTFKKDLRKKIAKHKGNLYLTGGGKPEDLILTPNEEKIYSIIYLSIEGLLARQDDDCRQINSNPTMERRDTPETIYLEDQAENVDEDREIVRDSGHRKPEGIDDLNGEETSSNKRKLGVLDNESEQKSTRALLKSSISQQLQPLHSINSKSKNIQSLTKLQAVEKVSVLSSTKKEVFEIQKKYYEQELEFKRQENKINLAKARKALQKEEIDVELKLIEKRIKEETLKRILQKYDVVP